MYARRPPFLQELEIQDFRGNVDVTEAADFLKQGGLKGPKGQNESDEKLRKLDLSNFDKESGTKPELTIGRPGGRPDVGGPEAGKPDGRPDDDKPNGKPETKPYPKPDQNLLEDQMKIIKESEVDDATKESFFHSSCLIGEKSYLVFEKWRSLES